MTVPAVSEQWRRFQEDGFLLIPAVLDEAAADRAFRQAMALRERCPEDRPELLNYKRVCRDPFWISFAAQPRLLEIAQSVLGPDILLHELNCCLKPPERGLPTAWHQDAYYLQHYMDRVVNLVVWVALAPATRENGCMRFVRGSHKAGRVLPHRDLDKKAWVVYTGVDSLPAGDVVELEMSRGSAVLIDPYVLHGAGPNRSRTWRAGAVCFYSTPSVRFIAHSLRAAPALYLLAGDARAGINTYEPMPSSAEVHSPI